MYNRTKPKNNLPNWIECQLRVYNSDSESTGPIEIEETNKANPIHRFIYEYDDADDYKSAWFLHRLENLIDFVKAESAYKVEVLDSEIAALKAELQEQALQYITLAGEMQALVENLNRIKEPLIDARSLAMHNTVAARIPECGDFGQIAQDLDFVCQELGLKL